MLDRMTEPVTVLLLVARHRCHASCSAYAMKCQPSGQHARLELDSARLFSVWFTIPVIWLMSCIYVWIEDFVEKEVKWERLEMFPHFQICVRSYVCGARKMFDEMFVCMQWQGCLVVGKWTLYISMVRIVSLGEECNRELVHSVIELVRVYVMCECVVNAKGKFSVQTSSR